MREPTYYHVITRGNNKTPVFHGAEDMLAYLEEIKRAKQDIDFSLHNFVLMTNHVHLIISVESPEQLSKAMKQINHRYSLWHRRRYGRIDHLWRNRYRRFVIGTDAYLLTCGIYIELNPVRAGMNDSPLDYPWSSHRFYANAEAMPLLTPNPAFLGLGNTDEERRAEYAILTEQWRANPPDKRQAKFFFKSKPTTLFPGLSRLKK